MRLESWGDRLQTIANAIVLTFQLVQFPACRYLNEHVDYPTQPGSLILINIAE